MTLDKTKNLIMKPDKYQLDAIKSNKNTLLIAGAGAGKTFTIIEKIKYLNPIHQANMTNLYNIVATETEILNIESICSNKAKLKFTEISNVKLKMYYYYTRNNIEKAKENAKKILDFSCDFKVYTEEAKRIISL